jgi:DNA (cytosine-5)-methyltransferase 1
MTHGSLFSGIGGFDLASEWCGWENVFHCEWNTFGQKVLKHHFPNSISYNDITKTDFTIHRGTIDIISGGFPCQPYSSAGKRLGKEDERHLWPEMLRAIREIQPSWVVGENVRGLTNWNGGLVFDEVQSELEAEGYEVLPFLLPAAAINAPHRRDRIWFIAYSNSFRQSGKKYRENETRRTSKESEDRIATNSNCNGLDKCNSEYEISTTDGRINALSNINESNGNGIATNTGSLRLEQYGESGEVFNQKRENVKREEYKSASSFETMGENVTNSKSKRLLGLHNTRNEDNINRENAELWRGFTRHNQKNYWDNFPTQSPICGGDDGLPKELDNITFSKWRNESIKAYGNAIVPQVAYQIFKSICQYQEL